MSTKFFIGGSEFYNDEEQAQEALDAFQKAFNIPDGHFVVVKLDRFDD